MHATQSAGRSPRCSSGAASLLKGTLLVRRLNSQPYQPQPPVHWETSCMRAPHHAYPDLLHVDLMRALHLLLVPQRKGIGVHLRSAGAGRVRVRVQGCS